MNPDISPSLKAVGMLAFLATGIIGWQLAAPPDTARKHEPAVAAGTHRTTRPPRIPRSATADLAGRRMGSLRAIADPESRLLATLSLVESLSPSEFADWMDHGWFDLRGGPELMIFSKILMDRWQREDPEGLLAWAAKNKNGAADGLMAEWVTREPQRLIDWFKSHRDDRKEFEILSEIAVHSPDLALQRLREMAESGRVAEAGYSVNLMKALAEKSPERLAALIDALPPALKLQAEGALSQLRLEASFADELHHLCSRPDGWKIFSNYFGSSEGISSKLLGELANLPPEWRSGLANSGNFVGDNNAQEWWDADFEGAGFSKAEAKSIRGRALFNLAQKDPEAAIQHLAELDLDSFSRRTILNNIFSTVTDSEKSRSLIAGLANEEDRKTATEFLARRTSLDAILLENGPGVETPEEMFSQLATAGSRGGSYISMMQNWEPDKIAGLSAGFKTLPEAQKREISQTVIEGMDFNTMPADFRDELIRYHAANPAPPKKPDPTDPWSSGSETADAKISSYVVNFSTEDPAAASGWVASLPAGTTKAWAQKNLLGNWKQYDPKAAAQWEQSLPAGERAALAKVGTNGKP